MSNSHQSIMVYHHLGLGDHFVCNGLVRHILETVQPTKLFLPTKVSYFSTVKQMYADQGEIISVPVKEDKDVQHLPCLSECDSVIQIGFSKVRSDWDVSFYDTMNVPFEYRWSKFKIVRDANRERYLKNRVNLLPDEKFVLIHNKGSDNIIQNLKLETEHRKIFVEPLTDCVLDWCELIERAEQVHCIDSSFVHLAQSIRNNGVFHKIRDLKDMYFDVKSSWSIQQYCTK